MITDSAFQVSTALSSLAQQRWQQLEQVCASLTTLPESQQQSVKQIIALSDFVFEQLCKRPELISWFFASAQAQARFRFLDLQQLLQAQLQDVNNEQGLWRTLRLFRNQYMLAIAWRDMLDHSDIETSMRDISSLADALISQTSDWCYQKLAADIGTPKSPQGATQPFMIYGMGKLGGGELNFSSDVDLIFCYPHNGETQGGRKAFENQQFFTRLGQRVIAALDQVTADGFVYRVDMRLRPFGESGPLALNFNALETYYQAHGRDWERYAMLKARLLPPQTAYHKELSDTLRPFVFRRYIDFSVIESLRRMQAMITQETRRKGLINNIKLGSGGIREIEFIVQAFQLIRGGQQVQLQRRSLLKTLPLLSQYGLISASAAERLNAAYLFLRKAEHVIQQIDDQQTQVLPESELDQARLCAAMGFADWAAFKAQLHQHMSLVHDEFLSLFGEFAPNQVSADSVWQSVWDSAEKQEILYDLLAAQGQHFTALSRPLHHFALECKNRSIGNRGRQQLDKLMPKVLELLAEVEEPVTLLARVQKLLVQILTRTAYLDLLVENRPVLIQLARLFAASEWIVEYICAHPILLDELIDPKTLYHPLPHSQYPDALRQWMLRVPEDDMEQQMEALRHFKQSHQLRVAAADVTGALEIMKVSDHLTFLAEAIMSECVNLAWHQMIEKYGYPHHATDEDKGFAVIAYGKLGGIELGYGSDLDLVFVHNCDTHGFTDGQRSIDSVQFYLKLAQRIVHLCSTRTASGVLYEIDTRLRPQGQSGLLVIHLNSFKEYLHNQAWTWEHQALVRSRLVFGGEVLARQFEQIRNDLLLTSRDHAQLQKDVKDMREKMRQHLSKDESDQFDLKQGHGGITDIEFIAQYLVLRYAPTHSGMGRWTDNVRIFEQAQDCDVIAPEEAEVLTSGYCQLRDESHRLALRNAPVVVTHQEFAPLRQQVQTIWQRYLGNAE